MKKIFFSFLIPGLFSLELHAQMQVGVRAGVHWSSAIHTRDGIDDRGFLPGFAIALPIQLPLTDRWGIRAEPSFIQNGWTTQVDYTTDLGTPAGTGKMILRYGVAELPLLVSFRSKSSNQFTYYGVLGPSIGYILGGHLKIMKDNAQDFSDQLHFESRIATGVWGGGGIELPIGGLTTFLDARYQYGVSRNLPFAYQGTMHGFTVSLGCWLPSKK